MVRFVESRVAVVRGGLSNERAVSLDTGKAVVAALIERGHEVIEIDPGHDLPTQLLAAHPNVVFNALHGTFGEDGRIQGLLDWMRLPYTGEGIRASLLAFDKVLAKQIYRSAGVPVADDYVLRGQHHNDMSIDVLPFALPVVVKPVAEGSSVGVHIARTPEEFHHAIQSGEHAQRLIEKFMEGPEFSVVCLGDELIGSVEIEPLRTFYDYDAKYGDHGTRYHVPPRLSEIDRERVEAVGLAAHRALGCRGVTRSDVILANDGPIALETNTLPGMTAHSLVPKVAAHAGMDFPLLIQRILDLATFAGQEDQNVH
jgi:D-alanine-D-alanine ligase